jgi:hypothetical protein
MLDRLIARVCQWLGLVVLVMPPLQPDELVLVSRRLGDGSTTLLLVPTSTSGMAAGLWA